MGGRAELILAWFSRGYRGKKAAPCPGNAANGAGGQWPVHHYDIRLRE